MEEQEEEKEEEEEEEEEKKRERGGVLRPRASGCRQAHRGPALEKEAGGWNDSRPREPLERLSQYIREVEPVHQRGRTSASERSGRPVRGVCRQNWPRTSSMLLHPSHDHMIRPQETLRRSERWIYILFHNITDYRVIQRDCNL